MGLLEYAGRAGLPLFTDADPEIDGLVERYRHWAAIGFGRLSGTVGPPPIDIGVVDRPTYNAIVGLDGGRFFILFNKGTLSRTISICRALVSQGVIGGELEVDNLVAHPQFDEWRIKDHFPDTPPLEDGELEALAESLAGLVLDAVFLHEFTHISNGHVRYISEVLGLDGMAELDGDMKAFPRGIVRQTLEWDADVNAADNLLGQSLLPQIMVRDGTTYWRLPAETYLGSREKAITRCVTALMISFLIMGCGRMIGDWDRDAIHPAPDVRARRVLGQVHHVLAMRTQNDENPWFDEVVQGIVEALSSWERLTGDVSRRDWVQAERWDEDLPQVRALRECWADLHDELDVRKIGGRLAPPIRSG